MGILQGKWFDSEELIKRDDIEIYIKPAWQYVVYFFILLSLIVINSSILIYYRRIDKSRNKYWITTMTILIMFSVVMFSIFPVCL